jgi:lipooligosaccharide transport system permease protein
MSLPMSGAFAVWRRHFLIYRKTWLFNVLPPITEPITYILSFGFGLSAAIGKFTVSGNDVTYFQFIAPGLVACGTLFQSFFEGAYASFIRLRMQRTWDALLTAPLSYTDIYVGDWLWAATRGIIAGVVAGLFSVLIGIMTLTGFLATLPVIVLAGLVFGGFGLLSTGCLKQIDHLNVPIFIIVIPMFSVCGTFFPRTNLPMAMQWVAEFLPLSQVVDLMRWPLGMPSYALLKIAVLILWGTVFTWLGWRIIRPQVFR